MGRDPLFPVIDPRAKIVDLGLTARVQQEVGDDGLVVMWDGQRQKFVILDRKAPGGPEHQCVMVVQEPDGSFRPIDGRTFNTLRKLRHHDVLKEELRRAEIAKAKTDDKRRQGWAEGMAEDLRWIGKDVVPSKAYDARTDIPEHIKAARRAAGEIVD